MNQHLGILEVNTSKIYLELVDDRSAATLVPIIQAHVRVGSTIWSDKWAAYNSLSELGYTHETVNHIENFVDLDTGYSFY